ncbi:MAG: cytochrome c oxidase assembly protein [Actinomycetia bacterium]|nr:cytochrome c oxidase assembly protein [Actinomycetes bacterium]
MFATDVWQWEPHPEVWVLIAGALTLGWFAVRVVQPKAVALGGDPVSGKQKLWFAGAVALLWIAADYPMHDVAEEELYSVHMVQHMLFAFVVPPMFLLATPRWLFELLIGSGPVGRWIMRLSRPVPAAFLFNVVAAFTHWKPVVNLSIENGAFHYVAHLSVMVTALIMWLPVVSPLHDMRITKPGQMGYLFVQSIIPTIPAAWLAFADKPIYAAYDHPDRIWNVIDDQQAAGLFMKLGGGIYLWTIIALIFFKWALENQRAEQRIVVATPAHPEVAVGDEIDLTFEDVRAEFDRTSAPPPQG